MQEKTEQPTQKKRRDAQRKGQVFKSQDLITLLVLGAMAGVLVGYFDYERFFSLFEHIVQDGFREPPAQVFARGFRTFLTHVLVIVGAATGLATLMSLAFTRFALSPGAIKFDLNRINPISGFKRIFSLRTLRDALKATFYFLLFSTALYVFLGYFRPALFSLIRGDDVMAVARMIASLGIRLVGFILLFFLLIVIVDAVAEFALYIRDLRMSKQEVKRDYKDSEGDPRIKGERKRLHQELLSEQVKGDVRQSKFVLANPTHIAIGIYFNPEISYEPFISVLETNARAIAVIRYAEEQGVPVLRDTRLARGVFKVATRYTFFTDDTYLAAILDILAWLEMLEAHYEGRPQAAEAAEAPDADAFALEETEAEAEAEVEAGAGAGAGSRAEASAEVDADTDAKTRADRASPTVRRRTPHA